MVSLLGLGVAVGIACVFMAIFAFLYVREVIRGKVAEQRHAQDIKEQRADAVKRSRSVIEGMVAEQLVPHFPEWKHTPSDARFIASPLDYVVFSGLSKDKVEEIIFVEVKTNSSQTTKRQRSVRDAIKNGKVSYELLEIKDVRQTN